MEELLFLEASRRQAVDELVIEGKASPAAAEEDLLQEGDVDHRAARWRSCPSSPTTTGQGEGGTPDGEVAVPVNLTRVWRPAGFP